MGGTMNMSATRRGLVGGGAGAAIVMALGLGVAASAPAEAAGARPAFAMPFKCGQEWRGSNWHGHDPLHSVDWNHYDANGVGDDKGRAVLASAGGTVLDITRLETSYGNSILIGHGDGWRTRYAHLLDGSMTVKIGDKVTKGEQIGKVGESGTGSPHLHYEQIRDGSVVDPVVQGVTIALGQVKWLTSKTNC